MHYMLLVSQRLVTCTCNISPVIKQFPSGGRCPQGNNYPYLFIMYLFPYLFTSLFIYYLFTYSSIYLYLLSIYLFVYIFTYLWCVQKHSTIHANPLPLAALTRTPVWPYLLPHKLRPSHGTSFPQWHCKPRSVGWPDENGGSETVWTLSWHNVKVRYNPEKSRKFSFGRIGVQADTGHPSAPTPTPKLRLWN
jgi:hypothetical protein